MLTGVIYGAIVIAWAAYLVPMALRRNEEESRRRSIERFSTAMRVLVRRGAAAAGEASAAGVRRAVSPRTTPAPASDAAVTSSRRPEPKRVLTPPTRNRATERAAAARRRTVLYVLLGLTVVVVSAFLVGLVPLWLVALPLLLVVGFLVVARLSVGRARKPHWVEVPAASAPVIGGTGQEGASEADHGDKEDEAHEEPTITLTAAQRSVAAPQRIANGSTLWDPVPVTLPTYVDAPVARRAFRTIELKELGTRSAAGPVDSVDSTVQLSTAPATQRTDAASVPPEVSLEADDAIDDVPRAVNG